MYVVNGKCWNIRGLGFCTRSDSIAQVVCSNTDGIYCLKEDADWPYGGSQQVEICELSYDNVIAAQPSFIPISTLASTEGPPKPTLSSTNVRSNDFPSKGLDAGGIAAIFFALLVGQQRSEQIRKGTLLPIVNKKLPNAPLDNGKGVTYQNPPTYYEQLKER
ncbi:9121_t:CDS:2 [Cetraspora pellucida]|uniref:9121_t:CDS:1 n=1 Tax=Cetraspora pellucida TaxID=1433469 RepID=A0ACA9LMP4_9GLOM|nr:9121_t:CDS:2 [Cetraspora pellucida]